MSYVNAELHAAITRAVDLIRDVFADNNMGEFSFEISASGRTQTDRRNVKIEYQLRADWGSNRVTGNTLSNVISECVRRNTWDHENKPLALTDDSDTDTAI